MNVYECVCVSVVVLRLLMKKMCFECNIFMQFRFTNARLNACFDSFFLTNDDMHIILESLNLFCFRLKRVCMISKSKSYLEGSKLDYEKSQSSFCAQK